LNLVVAGKKPKKSARPMWLLIDDQVRHQGKTKKEQNAIDNGVTNNVQTS
jgi:hypothetical protein